jgi:hypothetical protein
MAGKLGLLVGLTVAVGLLVGLATAQAAQRQCVGVIGPETVRGDVVVPAGAECQLLGTRVRGNVRLMSDSSALLDGASVSGSVESRGSAALNLISTAVAGNVRAGGGRTQVFGDGLEVGGTLEARGAEFFDLHSSTVNGNFYVRDTQTGSRFCGNTLNGNAEFTGNLALLTIGTPTASECDGNRVSGSMKVEDNEAATEISDNDIGGNLSCFDNVPPPFGGGNRVLGNKEGQCAPL